MGKKFKALSRKIEHAYEVKGYSQKEAKHIGDATAGKIYREKRGY